MKVLGIDIGGSGVKGAIVNIKTGKLVSEKIEDTSGSINFSLDDKYFFYSRF